MIHENRSYLSVKHHESIYIHSSSSLAKQNEVSGKRRPIRATAFVAAADLSSYGMQGNMRVLLSVTIIQYTLALALELLSQGEGALTNINYQGLKIYLIVTDYCMPGMTRYELFKSVKESPDT
ncbi:hypothetical protein Tco_0865695 [Tanacetum coccineum]